MARPKRGQPGHEEAARKWRETMLSRYGVEGARKKMQEIGRKGGRNGRGPNYTGGFAASHEHAVECGRKGGRISRRGPAKDDINKAEDILRS